MPLLLQPKPNIVISDDCAQLWATSWPTNGTVKDLGDALHRLIFHTKLRTQTYTLYLTGTINTSSKFLQELKEQDPQLVIMLRYSALLFHQKKILCYQLEIKCKYIIYNIYHFKVLNRKVGNYKLQKQVCCRKIFLFRYKTVLCRREQV